MKPVGIIILNWNGAALLRRYLPSVVAANSNDIADVVVVDNGSTDESLSVLKQEFPDVRTLCFDKNYGYAEGYNRAIRELGYRYSVLLNSDVAATPEWIRPLYEYMEAHPEVAACQPKILSDADHTKFEYAGASGGSSTSMDILSAADEYSTPWRPTTDNTTTSPTFSGLLVPR